MHRRDDPMGARLDLLIGQRAKSNMGPQAATAQIAMLDFNANQVSVDVKRDQRLPQGLRRRRRRREQDR
jgi:hypothetical protein